MADVTRDRGQLILVTGLLVAVAMVGLVLLLNTAIYTENLASRGSDQSSREAIEYRSTIADGVGGLIEEENEAEHGTYSPLKTDVESGIETIDDLTARNYALGGTLVRINQSTVATREGKLIRQTTSRPFRNGTGPTTLDDWELADGVDDDEIRDFRVTVTRSSLEANVDDGLTVYLENGTGATWEAFVYDDGGSVTVATSVDGGAKTDVCSVAASEATIDLTRGTLDDEQCQGLEWAEGLSGDYVVEFHNGENATGTYNVTIADPGGATIHPDNVDDGTSSTVYHVPAVYSASFEVSYESPTLTYRRDVRVAPGESG